MLKRIIFFWFTRFGLASAGYYRLGLLTGHRVFGAVYRMLRYHEAHPMPYIGICCFFYGLLAAGMVGAFWRRGPAGRVGIVALLCGLTVALSAPVGGMLWHWHDMQAGFFPSDWGHVLIAQGLPDGLAVGWLVVLLSVPYNLLGFGACYWLTRAGARIFCR